MVMKSAWRKGGWAWTKVSKLIVERDRIADGGKRICPVCGAVESDDVKFHVDHIVPCCLGGAELDLDNLWSLCSACNSRFGAKPKPSEVEKMAQAIARARNRMPSGE